MLQASKHVSRDYQYLKIKFSFKAQNDQTTCPAIQAFVQTILNFDQTLSVDWPLFEISSPGFSKHFYYCDFQKQM